MDKTVDARGLACPRPVMLTKQALRHVNDVTCIVDNPTARDNVARMASKEGCLVDVEERPDGIYLRITKQQTEGVCQVMPTTATVMVIGSETLGRGSDELGGVLMRSFFHTLAESEQLPATLIFLNSGVKLVIEESPVLDDIRALAGKGVQVLACGTCLGYYELKDRVAVGEVSNMYSILEAIQAAEKVISW